MKNNTLHSLSLFINNEYETLKKDYNKCTKAEKKAVPFTIYVIYVFDKLLEQQSCNASKYILHPQMAGSISQEGEGEE